MSLQITLLGTGTSSGVPIPGCTCEVCTSENPKNKRLRTSALITAISESTGETTHVLIDTGADFRTQALQFGLSRIDAVLYTHAHADHIFGLDDLRSFNFTNKMTIPIYASSETGQALSKIFSYAFFPDPDYLGGPPPKLELSSFEAYQPFKLSRNLEIEPLPILHGRMEVFGFRMQNFAYVTDCSKIPDATKEKLQGLDALVLDGLRYRPHPTHFNVKEAIAAIEELQPKKAFLTHMSHEVEHEEGNRQLRELTDLDVEFGYDGLVIETG